MKRQTDLQLIGYIGKYGCFFMTIAYWLRLVITKIEARHNQLNVWWMTALEEKDSKGNPIISGDVNGDGDMDDANELLIGDKTALCRLVGLPLEYVGSFSPDKVAKAPDQYYIGEFSRLEKGKEIIHFAGLDEDFKCAYDPILNSNTVRLGKIKTVRVFRKIKKA